VPGNPLETYSWGRAKSYHRMAAAGQKKSGRRGDPRLLLEEG
jgi:hypothetical protein